MALVQCYSGLVSSRGLMRFSRALLSDNFNCPESTSDELLGDDAGNTSGGEGMFKENGAWIVNLGVCIAIAKRKKRKRDNDCHYLASTSTRRAAVPVLWSSSGILCNRTFPCDRSSWPLPWARRAYNEKKSSEGWGVQLQGWVVTSNCYPHQVLIFPDLECRIPP